MTRFPFRKKGTMAWAEAFTKDKSAFFSNVMGVGTARIKASASDGVFWAVSFPSATQRATFSTRVGS